MSMTKILVIEDDEDVRDNLLDVLALEGYELTAAPNGRQGLQLARNESPDLILCDLIVPELNGYEVLQSVRQHADLATVPFIFLTGKAEKEYFRQGMELGADDYLTKPFTLSELLGAIETQLKKRDRFQQGLRHRLQQAELQLDYLRHHDSLVQLPNKLALQKWFASRDIACALERERDALAVCLLAIDRFDRLQKNRSHHAIASILQSVAQRLKCYHSDSTYLAYFNLNQFVFLLHNCDVRAFTQKILESFHQPFLVRNREIFLTASMGIALHNLTLWDLEDLLNRAEIAKSHAMQQGGNQSQYYTPALLVNSIERSFVETHLHQALAKQELQVYYQPQISAETGKIIGMEALMRWFHPQKGVISPAQFIPVAEELGLIVELGEWILQTACAQVKVWQERYQPDLSLAVNLSVRQLNDSQFCDRLLAILQQTRFPPHLLELELTESLLVENIQLVQKQIDALKSLGIAIAIDDFGTGYGSFNYLQQFRFDIVKIDRSFITDLHSNATNAAIVTAIADMAGKLNCRTIAEGVSTEADTIFLEEQGCHILQGYFFSPPLPSSEFAALLDAGGLFPLPRSPA